MNKRQKGYTLFELMTVLFGLLAAVGWGANIVAIANSDFSAITGMLVLMVIGIFVFPIGCITGWMAILQYLFS